MNANLRWTCDPSLFGSISLAGGEQAEIDDCKTLIRISEARKFFILGNWRSRITYIHQAALLRTHPNAFEWLTGEVRDVLLRFMPTVEKRSVEIPAEILQHITAFENVFSSLSVRQNEQGDVGLFGHYWSGRARSKDTLLAQWSIGHEPPTIAEIQLAARPPKSTSLGVWRTIKEWRPFAFHMTKAKVA